MKILIYTDVHFSQKSSIVNTMGNKYHKRLENCIESINWAESLAEELKCDEVITLGDFFDKPELNAEEITAVKEIKWSKLPHTFIVGNHESNINNLMWSSTMCLKLDNFTIVDSPMCRELEDIQLCLLPYIMEEDRKSIEEYFSSTSKKRVILSHNDIKGIQYGAFESKEGFALNNISNNCELFLNGHLHNGTWVNDKILNVGNLTGQNFTEDAFKYKHCAYVLDTATMKLTAYENPIAFRFYSIEIKNKSNLNIFNSLGVNAVVSIKCVDSLVEDIRELLKTSTNITYSRVIITHEALNDSTCNLLEQVQTINHLQQLETFVLDKLGTNNVVIDELKHICREA